jgi:acetoin:2,6-dichlorophenolindophenol oxidoreductase subunit alpha
MNDPTKTKRSHKITAAPEPPLPPVEQSLALLRQMQLIRAFEEKLRSLFSAGLVPGLLHLCAGQEAVAVGVCAELGTSDVIASNHRGHGHCLAKGARVDRMMAEVLGRRSGYGLGRSGTLHLFDAANGNLGTNGIVGGGIPLAAGAALSAKRRGRGEVAACFFGDGALNQGLLFEVLNMAAIWRLPAIFVCENNGYGEFTAIEDVTAGRDPVARGAVFDIPSEAVDGMDVLAVKAAAARAVTRARAGDGPSFLVCTTYRYGGHHVGDKQDYKDADEVRAWKEKDPILRLSRRLEAEGVASAQRIAALAAEVQAEVLAAAEAANADELPTADDLESFLYA